MFQFYSNLNQPILITFSEGEKSSNEGMPGAMPGKSPFYFGMEDFQQQQQQYRYVYLLNTFIYKL